MRCARCGRVVARDELVVARDAGGKSFLIDNGRVERVALVCRQCIHAGDKVLYAGPSCKFIKNLDLTDTVDRGEARQLNPFMVNSIRDALAFASGALKAGNLELAKKRIHQLEGMHALRYGTYPVAVMRPETVLWRAIRRLQERWVECGGNPDYWTGRKGEWE